MTRLLAILGHRVWAPVLLVAITVFAILPNFGSPGLWEPHELAIADRASARVDQASAPVDVPVAKGKLDKPLSRACNLPPDSDEDGKPDLTSARMLSERAAVWGFSLWNSDRGMRIPFELMGILTVLACAGVAYRLRGPRAALIAGLVCLSFPLLALQARQLTSEIGTACGASLIMYGLAYACRPAKGNWGIVDGVVAALALLGGIILGFLGGGALLGLLVPIGAFALASGGGLAIVLGLYRTFVYGARRITDGKGGRSPARFITWPFALLPAKRADSARDALGMPARQLLRQSVALLTLLGAVAILGVLAYQTYSIRMPVPGSRQLAGHSIIPSDCWSAALGGVWKFEDNLRVLSDGGIAQIAVGTFPWGLLAPIAFGMLLYSSDPRTRFAGKLATAWAALAWLCTALFLRKVGFTLYAGFPAMAIAIGVWLDRVPGWNTDDDARDETQRGSGRFLLIGLFFLLGVLVLAKDVLSFPDELTSLLTDIEINTKAAKVYPKAASIVGIPAKALVVLLGIGLAAILVAALVPGKRFAKLQRGARVALIPFTALLAIFWTHGWHNSLSRNLSSKQVFTTYAELRTDGDKLGIMGNMGNGPRYYGAGEFEKLTGRDQVATFLKEPNRVFAMVPFGDFCGIHRAMDGSPYYVLDNSSTRTWLLSNSTAGGHDQNPLASRIVAEEPTSLITSRPVSPIIFDGKIELVGWSMPPKVERGETFTVKMIFKVRAPVGGTYKMFVHFDGQGARFQADHDPIDKVCETTWWRTGDYIVDTFTVEAGDRSTVAGKHAVRFGFFTGTNPNWRNMKVSAAPGGAVDDNNRVQITTLLVE